MTREEIEHLLAQQERELAAFVEQANDQVSAGDCNTRPLAMMLQTPPPQEEPAQAE